MPRPGSKYTISGTRYRDEILVFENGYTRSTEGRPPEMFTQVDPTVISSGVVVKGGASDDMIRGGPGPDDIYGDGGADTLIGGAGLDRLYGGAGNDTLVDLDVLVRDADHADGNDPNADRGAIFDGGRGIDTIDFSGLTGSVGVSAHLGGFVHTAFTITDVNGRLVANWDPADTLEGRISNVENLIGSDNGDILWGNWQDNEIRGGGGDDYIVGGDFGPSNDALFGDAGHDQLYGGTGNNRLEGGSGADNFVFDGLGDSGATNLVLDYSKAEGDVLVFMYQTQPVTSVLQDHDGDGDQEIVLAYSGGQVVVDGITDIGQLSIVTTPNDIW